MGNHWVDDDGNPAGGCSQGVGFVVCCQNGALVDETGVRVEQSGAFVEHVIEAVADRIRFYQVGRFACKENRVALVCLEDALEVLRERRVGRVKRGVEGTHQV